MAASSRVNVVALEIDSILDASSAHVPQGSLIVLIAEPGSALLAQLESAIEHRNLQRFDELSGRVSRVRPGGRGPRGHSSPDAVPVFADIRYGDVTLVQEMFVGHDAEVARYEVPYDGGDLRSEKFQLVEHARPDGDVHLQALVILRKPALSELERRFLDEAAEVVRAAMAIEPRLPPTEGDVAAEAAALAREAAEEALQAAVDDAAGREADAAAGDDEVEIGEVGDVGDPGNDADGIPAVVQGMSPRALGKRAWRIEQLEPTAGARDLLRLRAEILSGRSGG